MSVRCYALPSAFTLAALLSGCAATTPPDTIGGYKPPAIFAGFMSPQVSRTSCVDAVERYSKVPKDNIKPLGDSQTMQDGIYVVTLSAGPGQPNYNCTVNENGNVSDVIRAR